MAQNPENPCPKTPTQDSAFLKQKRSFIRSSKESLHRKGSNNKSQNKEQVIAFVPDPSGKKTFYSTDKEDSKNYEPVIAFSSTDDSGKKKFYITDKASLCRKCKPVAKHYNEVYLKDVNTEEDTTKYKDKGLTDKILDMCQKTVVAASVVEVADESKNTNITIETTNDTSRENTETIQEKSDDTSEHDTCRENYKKGDNNSENENNDKYAGHDKQYNSNSKEQNVAEEHISTIRVITIEKGSNVIIENVRNQENTDNKKDNDDDCEDCVIFPGAQEVFKRVQEIREDLFNTHDRHANLKEDPCEPKEINYSVENEKENTPETLETEPVLEQESPKTIFESVKSKVYSLFVKKSSVSESNVTYKVETNMVSSVHARDIDQTASLYQTMRKKVTSIFSFNNKSEENNTQPELQLDRKSTSRFFLNDLFFDDGFTSK